jgi:hypothetical protein
MSNGVTVTGIFGKKKISVTLDIAVNLICKMELHLNAD